MGKLLVLLISVLVGVGILWRLNVTAHANADNKPRERPPPEL